LVILAAAKADVEGPAWQGFVLIVGFGAASIVYSSRQIQR
jgi:hypothetical protein